jgi:hypothetical protein
MILIFIIINIKMELIKQICLYLLDENKELNVERYPLLQADDLIDNWKGCYIELGNSLGTIHHPQARVVATLFGVVVFGLRREPEHQLKRKAILQILSQNPEALIPLDLFK